jgi:hypothetical protein
LVVELADVIYVLELGQVLASGRPDEIQSDPRVISSYLGEAAIAERSRPSEPAAADQPEGDLR